MATANLTHLWQADFEDGHTINQPHDDRYSKHDDSAEWNPSAFRDVLEYDGQLKMFWVGGFGINLETGMFRPEDETDQFSLEQVPLTERKLIYYRETIRDNINGEWQVAHVSRYVIGYEGKNPDGEIEKKVLYING